MSVTPTVSSLVGAVAGGAKRRHGIAAEATLGVPVNGNLVTQDPVLKSLFFLKGDGPTVFVHKCDGLELAGDGIDDVTDDVFGAGVIAVCLKAQVFGEVEGGKVLVFLELPCCQLDDLGVHNFIFL